MAEITAGYVRDLGPCFLCGHEEHETWAGVYAEVAGHPGISLCHEDDHSCYEAWTVWGKRPRG